MQLILKTLVTISYSFTQDQLPRALQILQERRKQKATPTEQPTSQNFRRTFYFFPLPKPAPGLPEPANQHSSPTTNTLPAFWKPLKATQLQEVLLFHLRLEERCTDSPAASAPAEQGQCLQQLMQQVDRFSQLTPSLQSLENASCLVLHVVFHLLRLLSSPVFGPPSSSSLGYSLPCSNLGLPCLHPATISHLLT